MCGASLCLNGTSFSRFLTHSASRRRCCRRDAIDTVVACAKLTTQFRTTCDPKDEDRHLTAIRTVPQATQRTASIVSKACSPTARWHRGRKRHAPSARAIRHGVVVIFRTRNAALNAHIIRPNQCIGRAHLTIYGHAYCTKPNNQHHAQHTHTNTSSSYTLPCWLAYLHSIYYSTIYYTYR